MEDIKSKSLEEKVETLRKYMNCEVEDKTLALNVFLLIKKGKTFSDDLFSSEQVIYNDILEFLDIKDALEDDLKQFVGKLLGFYISCFKHCGIGNVSSEESIPNNYLYVLYMLDIMTLSKLCDSYEPIDDNKTYKNAFSVVASLSKQFSIYYDMIETNLEA